jgi:hypothetical protein
MLVDEHCHAHNVSDCALVRHCLRISGVSVLMNRGQVGASEFALEGAGLEGGEEVFVVTLRIKVQLPLLLDPT